METPEKFNLSSREQEKTPDAGKEEVEFRAWQQVVGRRIDQNRVLSKEKGDQHLGFVDPSALTREDMSWDRKIRGKNFDPEEFKAYQVKTTKESKGDENDPRFRFMRSLTDMAQKELDTKKWFENLIK